MYRDYPDCEDSRASCSLLSRLEGGDMTVSILPFTFLSIAVRWSVFFSEALIDLNGPVMAGSGVILMMLSVALERWVDE